MLIDSKGKKAVEYFENFKHPDANNNAFQDFLLYLSVQKIRTPKGLNHFSSLTKLKEKNQILFKMQEFQNMHSALWSECVWSIVDASKSDTKFIISDNPVTLYNQGCFPKSSWCRGNNEPPIWLNGTHTIFPLSLEKALILTNLSWVRNPHGNTLRERPNPQLFRQTVFSFLSIQTGRELSEQDVLAINYIIKNRAKRYIASAKKEWLFPEKYLEDKKWDSFGKKYLLMPDPRSMTFSSEVIVGYKDRKSDAFDEYGRRPWDKNYSNKKRHDEEWNTFQSFKGEYARLFGAKRRGTSYEMGREPQTIDDDEYHAYHLESEQLYKKPNKSKRRNS